MAAPQHRYLVLYEPAAGTLNITGKSVSEDDSANAVDSFFYLFINNEIAHVLRKNV